MADPAAVSSVCAFCGKDAHEVEGMVASRQTSICRTCITDLYEMFIDDCDTAVTIQT